MDWHWSAFFTTVVADLLVFGPALVIAYRLGQRDSK